MFNVAPPAANYFRGVLLTAIIIEVFMHFTPSYHYKMNNKLTHTEKAFYDLRRIVRPLVNIGYLASASYAPYTTYSEIEKLKRELLAGNGAFNGDEFREWIDKLIEEKTGIANTTFAQLHDLKDKKGITFKDIHVIGV